MDATHPLALAVLGSPSDAMRVDGFNVANLGATSPIANHAVSGHGSGVSIESRNDAGSIIGTGTRTDEASGIIRASIHNHIGVVIMSDTNVAPTVEIRAEQWAMYNNVTNNGMTKKDAAAAAGYKSGGGGGAAYDRVRSLIDAGTVLTVGGVVVHGPGVGTEGTPTESREDVAEDILPGSSPMLAAFDAMAADRVNLARTIERHEDAITKAREAYESIDARVTGFRDVMGAAGFDWEAFDARTAPVTESSNDDDDDDDDGTESSTDAESSTDDDDAGTES